MRGLGLGCEQITPEFARRYWRVPVLPGGKLTGGACARRQPVAGMLTAPNCKGCRPARQLSVEIGEFSAGAGRHANGS
jgi:hypothetical protein